jgi:hypothetical protein
MVDIILDDNAFRLLLKNEYIEKIIEKCDHIFISKHWKSAYKYIKELYTGFVIFSNNIKKLRKNKKFHESLGRANLPSNIQRELINKKASNGNFEVVRIAYDRRIGNQNVFLVSNDHHILQLKTIFISNGIIIETLEQELERALKKNSLLK